MSFFFSVCSVLLKLIEIINFVCGCVYLCVRLPESNWIEQFNGMTHLQARKSHLRILLTRPKKMIVAKNYFKARLRLPTPININAMKYWNELFDTRNKKKTLRNENLHKIESKYTQTLSSRSSVYLQSIWKRQNEYSGRKRFIVSQLTKKYNKIRRK